MKTAVLFFLLAVLAAGCAAQESLFKLANAPGKIELSAPSAYKASLAPCTSTDVTDPKPRRERIIEAWRPVIDGFQEAHEAFCELLTDSPVCLADKSPADKSNVQ